VSFFNSISELTRKKKRKERKRIKEKKEKEKKEKDEEIKRIKEENKKKDEEMRRTKEEKGKEGPPPQEQKPKSSSSSLITVNSVVSSEIEFIKPLDGVKIQGRTITFTKDLNYRTVFMKKMINSGIMRMFVYNFYIYIFYSVREVLCICTDNRGAFGMRNYSCFLLLLYLFNFFLF
jgi:hypothetical protein